MATLNPSSEDNRIYEICLLYPPNLSQKDESTLLKEIEGLFDEAGGKHISTDKWGKRGLAYRIGGHDEGCYIIYYYDMDPSTLKELEENLRIMPNVLRHLVVKPPKDYEIVSYADKYVEWQKHEAQAGEREKAAKEKALQKKVAEKAKRQAAKAAKAKKTEEKKETKEADSKKINEELDKLISDDDLDL